MEKKKAKKGYILYCKELNRYATATTDTKYNWEEVEDAKENR